ncbi:MAG: DUF456 domain-containing protein [Alistipes sp.]|nr:DUF456 domain-containing protein [Alistipes sp.]
METTLAIVAIICALVGTVGCVVPIIPGGVVTYVGYICLYFCSGAEVSTGWLVAFGLLTAAVTIMDFVLPAYMSRRFGGSREGQIGATVGMLAGFFLGPFGILAGPFVGAMVGELLHNSKEILKALRVGFGSFLSFIVGTGAKLAISLWITVDIVIKAIQLLS